MRREFVSVGRPGTVVSSMPVRAAGGIVVRRGANSNEWEVALVYRSSHGDWGFPKGKLEPGETELFCARREVEEETGLLCNIGAYVGQTQYVDRRKRPKIVHYWLMEPLDGAFAPTEEIDDMQWVHARHRRSGPVLRARPRACWRKRFVPLSQTGCSQPRPEPRRA